MSIARKPSPLLLEPWWIRWPLIALAALLFIGVLLIPFVPLLLINQQQRRLNRFQRKS